MKIKGVAVKWQYPESTERDFSRSIQGMIDGLVSRMKGNFSLMKFDEDEDKIERVEEDLENYADALIAALLLSLPAFATAIYKFNTKQFLRVAKSAGGKENQSVILIGMMPDKFRPEWYGEQYALWAAQARTSVKRLASNVIDDYTNQLRTLSANNSSKDEAVKVINGRYKVYSSWGKNRSSGIINTFNSRLMRQRIKDTGVTHYMWRGVMDAREREKHVRWEGKIIRFDSDHVFPAEEYNCRCWAVPVFD